MDSSEVSWAQVVVLALIQGVTEFLPVSSSAHLVLPSALTDWPNAKAAASVTPDRDAPGTMATACAKPMSNAGRVLTGAASSRRGNGLA